MEIKAGEFWFSELVVIFVIWKYKCVVFTAKGFNSDELKHLGMHERP
jgi:hypothetical protein